MSGEGARDLIDNDRDVLLRLALGAHAVRTEHRFRHKTLGLVREQLDLREDDPDDWDSQWRTVAETEWR